MLLLAVLIGLSFVFLFSLERHMRRPAAALRKATEEELAAQSRRQREVALPRQTEPAAGTTIACPLYSGPGFGKAGAKYTELHAINLHSPYQGLPEPPTATLQQFSLRRLRLLAGSAQWASMQVNLNYLLSIDPDTLLWAWRRNAGEHPKGRPAGGWEAPHMELRGHFLGHYLSACAMTWASTNHSVLDGRMRYVVSAMAEVAARLGGGYLSAFPESLLDRFERIEPVWAPYYTLHKVLQGLLDQYTIAGSSLALQLAIGLAAYVGGRLERVLSTSGLTHHWATLNMEYGGMNDVLWQLAAITGRPEHRRWASLFDKPCFLSPQATHEDRLSKMHANTHVPIAIGALHRHEVTGEPVFRLLAENFLDLLNTTRTFATGGSSHHENWGSPNKLGHLLGPPPFGTVHQESCVTHNTLRLAIDLFRSTRLPQYADFIERLQLNGVLGTQRGTQPGQMLYFYPLGTGVSKKEAGINLGTSGWSHPTQYFSCCMGTGIEAHAKLQEATFFFAPPVTAAAAAASGGPGSPADLWLVSLVPTELVWPEQRVRATLTANGALDVPSGTPCNATLTLTPLQLASPPERHGASDAAGLPSSLRLKLRIPRWARAAAAAAALRDGGGDGGLRGSVSGAVAAGSTDLNVDFWSFELTPPVRTGEEVSVRLSLPAALHVEPLKDPRCQYKEMTALLYGPLVLAGLTTSGQSELHGRWRTSTFSRARRRAPHRRMLRGVGASASTTRLCPSPRTRAASSSACGPPRAANSSLCLGRAQSSCEGSPSLASRIGGAEAPMPQTPRLFALCHEPTER